MVGFSDTPENEYLLKERSKGQKSWILSSHIKYHQAIQEAMTTTATSSGENPTRTINMTEMDHEHKVLRVIT